MRRITTIFDQHEFIIDIKGYFQNDVSLKIDKIDYSYSNSGSTWDKALFFEYYPVINNHKRKIVIMLLKNHVWASKDFIIVVYEKSILIGRNLYREYKEKHYKYIIYRKEMLGKNIVVCIILLEWKKIIGYYLFGILILIVFNMIDFLVAAIFGVLVIVLFFVIGIWDNRNVKKEVENYER